MGLIALILLIIGVAVALKFLEVGGKAAQLIWFLVAVVVVVWFLSIIGLWNPPRGVFH